MKTWTVKLQKKLYDSKNFCTSSRWHIHEGSDSSIFNESLDLVLVFNTKIDPVINLWWLTDHCGGRIMSKDSVCLIATVSYGFRGIQKAIWLVLEPQFPNKIFQIEYFVTKLFKILHKKKCILVWNNMTVSKIMAVKLFLSIIKIINLWVNYSFNLCAFNQDTLVLVTTDENVISMLGRIALWVI